MNEVVREFVLETHENLAQLDLDLVTLEKDPTERETLARVFRTLHTVKGTAGFLGLPKLQAVAHAGENLLGKLRANEMRFDASIATVLLSAVDSIRRMVASIEASGDEGGDDPSPLIHTLEQLLLSQPGTVVLSAMPPLPAASPSAPASTPVATESQAPPPQSSSSGSSVVIPEAGESRSSGVSDTAIRVDVGLLDKLMTLVGELVLARNQILQFSTSQEDPAFLGTVQRLNVLTTELQAGVMKTRMQPIGNIWSKFPRLVRDIALSCSKMVRIDLDGQETELDKTIIEAIRDPLTHLVRNAIDHGIETPGDRVRRGKPEEGRLLLHAFHEGGKVIIELTDDGGGIDPQRIRDKALQSSLITPIQAAHMTEDELVNLVFLPGFSTSDQVTQLSGRGVGMDVVRTNIEKIGGTVDIETRHLRGTTVKMKIPLTLAIIPALTITSAGDRYAIPQVSLLELVRLEGEQARKGIELIHGTPVYRLRGQLLPLVHLDQQFQFATTYEPAGRTEYNIVVLQADDRQFGLIVDDIHDTEEIVVKPLQKQLKGISVFAGATIMGDGKVALILDVLGLAQKSNVVAGVRERARTDRSSPNAEPVGDRLTVLVFETPAGARMAIPLSQVDRLEEFPRSALERVGTQDVVQYRDDILPLLHVDRALRRQRRLLEKSRSRANGLSRLDWPLRQPMTPSETVQVVVHVGTAGRVGLVVGTILDVVEETISSRSRPNRPGVLFNAVIQERVTEILDVEGILRVIDPAFLESGPRAVAARV